MSAVRELQHGRKDLLRMVGVETSEDLVLGSAEYSSFRGHSCVSIFCLQIA